VINLFDPDTGQLVAVLDGEAITTRRTAAASALAVDILAPPESAELAIIGSGVQALAHAQALARVRRLRAIRLWSPTPAHRERAAHVLAVDLGLTVTAVDTAEQAVADMPMVVTCTLSSTPVVQGAWLADGCTLVSVGSFEPTRCEVDDEVLRRAAAVVVDDPATAVEHAGPIIQALANGLLVESRLIPLGAVLTGRLIARRSARDIVFYNSVGLGIQDAAAAWSVLEAAGGSPPPHAKESA
jgi:ornithine cyclodeaminase